MIQGFTPRPAERGAPRANKTGSVTITWVLEMGEDGWIERQAAVKEADRFFNPQLDRGNPIIRCSPGGVITERQSLVCAGGKTLFSLRWEISAS